MAEITREDAVHAFASKIYDRSVPRSAPPFEAADPMVRHALLERANDVINDVLEVMSPASPDVETLRLRLGILADEIEGATDDVLLVPSQVAHEIRRAVAGDYGEARTDG